MRFTDRSNTKGDFILFSRRFFQGVLCTLVFFATPYAQAALHEFTDATAFQTALAGLGFAVETQAEGFEPTINGVDTPWASAISPSSLPEVSHLGVRWFHTNSVNPGFSIVTNGGDTQQGQYAMNLPGLLTISGTNMSYAVETGGFNLVAFGGWFKDNNAGAKPVFTLNDGRVVEAEPLGLDWEFRGFIDDDPIGGFTQIFVTEAETGNEIEYFYTDAVTLAAQPGLFPPDSDSDGDGVLDNSDLCPNTPIGEAVDANGCSASQLDSDGDGVFDDVDLCPNTPTGETVDANGCSTSQLDSDGDGIFDNLDLCPNTPTGEAVDANGCSASQLDSDGDGVFDNLDLCPNTPTGEAVDANGCSTSQLDSDGDGVFDNVDLCPGTPAGATVDANGCIVILLDSDGDGVLDNLDQCPNTPTGEAVDTNGCSLTQLDTDNDGVNDALDQCPNTPAGETVDTNGCSTTQLDSDNDGVADNLDLCPNTPAGETVDTNGCSTTQLDSDNDGVADNLDLCPNTPAGETVDTNGCSTTQLDSDNDGVTDNLDLCPNTPAGEAVDTNGCSTTQLDTDNDGVTDNLDQCPNTPTGEAVDTNGCSTTQLDSDNDGVADNLDLCPNTPAAETVDTNGCSTTQLDSDNDGVADNLDLCPNTPAGEAVDATGCPISQLDSDNDGVSDALDLCPNTPVGETVDANGCSTTQLDSDNDGVADNLDLCPNTPAGEAVDATGCPISQLDSDNDGVSDALDLCPNTPVGETVDANGCSTTQLDSDNDGVTDNLDLCPNTPAGEVVDTNGCSTSQLDSDNDGVADNLDLCPNTPAGEAVDATGCPISQLDSDNDGVSDALDLCPNTPVGETVDANGCSTTQLDSDNDGVADRLDLCPNTPAGEAVDADGCSTSQIDTDGDGVMDDVDNCPLVANTDQSDIDADGLGDVCDELSGSLPVITIPADFLHILVDSSGMWTSVELGDVMATDAEDGDLTPDVTADQTSPFVTGHHEISYSVTDSDGNTVTAVQIVDIKPQASFGPSLRVEAGSRVEIWAYLNGQAVDYPVTIELTSNDIPISGSGTIMILQGKTEGSTFLDIPVDAPSDVVLAMGEITNAIPGRRTKLRIRIINEPVAPVAQMTAEQAGALVRTAYRNRGDVVITATVKDPNQVDLNAHDFDWSQTDNTMLSAATVSGDQLIIDPTDFPVDVYTVKLVVTDTTGLSTAAYLLLNLEAQEPDLSTAVDSDGDGVSDADEGSGDMDQDGIPDYLDSITLKEVLPLIPGVDRDHLMITEPGLSLRLGSVAFISKTWAAEVKSVIEELMGTSPELNAMSDVFEFEIAGLAYPGQSAQVVISLLEQIPQDAVYRKFTLSDIWQDIVTDENNAVASAQGEAGICPAHGDTAYVPGLQPGAHCVQMTIEDGGPNDGDGSANGTISDPGGVAVKTVTPTTSSGGGGGAAGLLFLLILALGMFARGSNRRYVKLRRFERIH